MDPENSAKAKRILTALAVVWLLLGSWLAFFALPASDLVTINSQQVKDRMRDECTGSYQSRYDCKENIIVQVGQDAFAGLALRLILVLSGPLFASVLSNTVFKATSSARPAKPDDMEWKTKAVVAAATTIDRSREPTLEPVPPPEDDWKKRAQQRIAAAKPPAGPPDWLVHKGEE